MTEGQLHVTAGLPIIHVHRMMQEYQASTAQEGELNEDELPSDLVQDIEDAAGRDRQCFAVSMFSGCDLGKGCCLFCAITSACKPVP